MGARDASAPRPAVHSCAEAMTEAAAMTAQPAASTSPIRNQHDLFHVLNRIGRDQRTESEIRGIEVADFTEPAQRTPGGGLEPCQISLAHDEEHALLRAHELSRGRLVEQLPLRKACVEDEAPHEYLILANRIIVVA